MKKKNYLILTLVIVFLFMLFELAIAFNLEELQKNSPTQYDFPAATAIILKDEITYCVNPDQTRTQIEHEAIKILNSEAVSRFGTIAYYYDPSFQEIHVDIARTLTPEGKIISLDPKSIKDYAPLKKLKLFSHIRKKVIQLPEVKTGCIIEYKVRLEEKRPFIPNQFWTVSYTQDYQPILESRLTIKAPPEFKNFKYKVFGSQGLLPEITETPDEVTYTFCVKDCLPIPQEIAQPSLFDLASQIRATSFSSWDEFAKLYRKDILPLINATPKVFTLTQKIIANKDTSEKKIKTIYKYILNNIKLVDLGWGRFSFSVHTPEEVLKYKQGDQADIMVLFLSMLQAAQIKGYPALVSTREHGKLREDLPDPQQFNYCLVAVPVKAGFWFLDPGSEFNFPLMLKPSLQNRRALVLLPQKAQFVSTPIYPYYLNREESKYECLVASDDKMEVAVEIKEYGCQDLFLREFFNLFSKGRLNLLMNLLAKTVSPDARLIESYISSLKDTTFPLTIDLSFEILDYAKLDGNLFYFRLPIFPARKIRSLVIQDPKERIYPLMLNTPTQTDKNIHIIFPEKMKPKSLPPPIYIENSVGSYQFIYNVKENNFWGYSRLIIKKSEIPPAEFKEFKDLIETSFRTEGELILLEKEL